MYLFGAQRAFVLAEEVADPRQNCTPHGGPNGGIADELWQRHAMQPGRNRNEMPDYGKQPSDERADFAVLREEPLGAQQILLAQEDVFAVALNQRPADQAGAVVIRERADDAAHDAAQQRDAEVHLTLGCPIP